MLKCILYIGVINSPQYGVSTRGNFEPLISEQTFYRAQAVAEGRVQRSAPRVRNHPDFPLRGFVHSMSCSSRTGSRSMKSIQSNRRNGTIF